MQVPTNAPRRLRQRRRPQRGTRGEINMNASMLLLSLVLLAETPGVARGWAHNARYAGQAGQAGGGSPTSAAVGTAPPVFRQRMLDVVALRARRSGHRFPSRLASAASTEAGKTFEAPVVEGAVAGQAAVVDVDRSTSDSDGVATERYRVDQMKKEWGAKGMWREAMEQLEKERRGGRKPVSGLCRVGGGLAAVGRGN